ncbi:MAG: class I SAM-dependent methyltransferase [Planctomycetota bacterium]|jgi:SAM-dependent methyltransferase
MTTQTAVDEQKTEAFREKALGDMSGTMAIVMCAIGDRLGLFKDLASKGPATSAELADRVGLDERYAREWLAGMHSAGYLAHDGADGRYVLPDEHAPVLADEGGPMFVAGVYEMIPALLKPLDELLEAFRNGGGVHQSSYGQHFWCGMQRFTGTWFENWLVQEWVPLVPDLAAKLERGARAVDIGCGTGMALIKLAQVFPRSTFVGYDVHAPAVAEATANAEAAGVADRVGFEQLDVVQGLPEAYDMISTFDVVHDMADPRGALRAIRQALAPDGVYLMLDVIAEEKPHENTGPVATLKYGFSLTYCMTTSLANNGVGLGTLGLPESKVREFCAEAGFGSVRRLPWENPFNAVYEIKA